MTAESEGRDQIVGMPTDVQDPEALLIQDEAWRIVELARHPERPHTLELIRLMVDTDSTGKPLMEEVHGDRFSGDDQALVGGFATIGGRPLVFIGHQKGDFDVQDRIKRNFGMPHPEGYRKAKRLFKLAEKFELPVVTFIDTPGADSSVESEEKGQALAIADSIQTMALLKTPIITVIVGEGGSGGALAIATADRILAFANSYYSVISPEGCAKILGHTDRPDLEMIKRAAVSLRLTAAEQLKLGVIGRIILEPDGGGHLDHSGMARKLKEAIIEELDRLAEIPLDQLVQARYDRYRNMGQFQDPGKHAPETPPKKRMRDRFRRHPEQPQP